MKTMNFRVNEDQKKSIESNADKLGFDSVGAFIKFVTINATVSVAVPSTTVAAHTEKESSMLLSFTSEIDVAIGSSDDDFDGAYRSIGDCFSYDPQGEALEPTASSDALMMYLKNAVKATSSRRTPCADRERTRLKDARTSILEVATALLGAM